MFVFDVSMLFLSWESPKIAVIEMYHPRLCAMKHISRCYAKIIFLELRAGAINLCV